MKFYHFRTNEVTNELNSFYLHLRFRVKIDSIKEEGELLLYDTFLSNNRSKYFC